GPAAAASVISASDGEVLDEHAQLLGTATNNVAEYRALLLGLERARALGAHEVEVVGDSELIAKQLQGSYKVKNEALRALHARASRGSVAALGAVSALSWLSAAAAPSARSRASARWRGPRAACW